MLVKDFDYQLPAEKIAQKPVEPRDSSKLLVLDKQKNALEHRRFYDIIDYLSPKDLLVFNDSKVIPARLIGKKSTGATIEVFLLHQENSTDWQVLVKPGRKVQIGTKIIFDEDFFCTIKEKTPFGGRIASFNYQGDFLERISKVGQVPLPPYIHEKLEDFNRYQTVYAQNNGSVAAPTAGLHFTDELLEKIRAKGTKTAFLTLHVGIGTFRPVTANAVDEHVMHSEYYNLDETVADLINQTKKNGGRVICVGTTAVRVLESVAKADGSIIAKNSQTNIFIYPGYKFKVVDALITNFHLPQSTLLMLVSAFSSREGILHAYETALGRDYLFFSFGDAMFIK